jgi:hypothetical protein
MLAAGPALARLRLGTVSRGNLIERVFREFGSDTTRSRYLPGATPNCRLKARENAASAS